MLVNAYGRWSRKVFTGALMGLKQFTGGIMLKTMPCSRRRYLLVMFLISSPPHQHMIKEMTANPLIWIITNSNEGNGPVLQMAFSRFNKPI